MVLPFLLMDTGLDRISAMITALRIPAGVRA
jgi:hypothetical protein